MAKTGDRFFVDAGDLEWDRPRPGGVPRAPVRPPRDRGEGAVEDAANRRFFDAAKLQQDHEIAVARRERTEDRLRNTAPGSRIHRRFLKELEVHDRTIATLRRHLEYFDQHGTMLGLTRARGAPLPPVGARVRNVRSRRIPMGEEVTVVDYRRGQSRNARDYDQIRVRRPDGSLVNLSRRSVEMVEAPATAGRR